MRLDFEMNKRSYETWNICTIGKNCKILENILTSSGLIIKHIK